MSSSLFAPVQSAFNTCSGYIESAYTAYKEYEDIAVRSITQATPSDYRPLVDKVCRALPEAIFAATLVSNKLKLLAYAYGTARIVWISLPVLKTLVEGKIDKDPMTQSINDSKARLQETLKLFSPAIFVVFSVHSAVCAAGIVTGRVAPLFTASLSALVARLGYNEMQSNQTPTGTESTPSSPAKSPAFRDNGTRNSVATTPTT